MLMGIHVRDGAREHFVWQSGDAICTLCMALRPKMLSVRLVLLLLDQ